MNDATALFLTTGTPTVLLLVLGFVIVPQGVATARTNGTLTYQRAMPVPRPLLLLSDLTIWLLIALPSVGVAILVGWLTYGISLSVAWPTLIAGCLLVTLMATSVGYALAISFPPMVAQALTQALVVIVMLFSPVNFPASQLPQWYQNVHDFLPVESGADLIRSGLASAQFESSARDIWVLGAWTVVGLAITLKALTRRS